MADTRRPRSAGADVVEPTAISTAPELGVLKLSTKAEAPEVEMIPLFVIDDVEYKVPVEPSPRIGLRYLHILSTDGEEKAAYYMLTKMLGEEGYEALMNYEQLTQDQYDFVLTAAIRIATGKTERPKGPARRRNGPSGRRS